MDSTIFSPASSGFSQEPQKKNFDDEFIIDGWDSLKTIDKGVRRERSLKPEFSYRI